MKNLLKDFLDKDTLFIIFISLLIGLVIGVYFQTSYSIGLRTALHNITQKLNPDSKKDSKTLIMEKAGTYTMPETIFDTPKKENKLIIFIKRFLPKKETTQTLDNFKK